MTLKSVSDIAPAPTGDRSLLVCKIRRLSNLDDARDVSRGRIDEQGKVDDRRAWNNLMTGNSVDSIELVHD